MPIVQSHPADSVERLARRPWYAAVPIMHQNWGRLLFLHWPIAREQLGSLVPPGLEIECHDGRAWISVVPFTMWGIRASGFFPLPFMSRAHELNVRTYVSREGIPGVWFFSLDINSVLMALGGRWGFSLPYFRSSIRFRQSDGVFSFQSIRGGGAPRAEFDAEWSPEQSARPSQQGSLEAFLLERYCLYSWDGARLWRGRIRHTPWLSQPARLHSYRSTMVRSLGLEEPRGEPLLHYADSKSVEIFAVERA